jgi:hypothetical protein
VNVVNGQNNAYGVFVQLGYATQSCSDNCQNGFANSRQDFWYTAYANGVHYGEIFPATWVDWNNNGIHDYPADYPVVGRNYEFTISDILASNVWRSSIKDETTGLTETHDVTAHASWLSYAWWGMEVWNDASAIGARSGVDPAVTITPMQYLNQNGSIWSTVTGDSGACNWHVTGTRYPIPDHWLSEECDFYSVSSVDEVDADTASHN